MHLVLLSNLVYTLYLNSVLFFCGCFILHAQQLAKHNTWFQKQPTDQRMADNVKITSFSVISYYCIPLTDLPPHTLHFPDQ